MSRRRPSLPWQLQFVALAATWGASFLFIKVLDRHWPALWVAFGRVAVGALTLAVLVRLRHERLPRDPRIWLHCAVLAVFFNAAPWTLFAYGEQHTSSVVAGLWNATTALWVLLFSLAVFGEERPTAQRIAGLAIGFIGVTTLLGPWRGLGSGALVGHLACAGAAMCYGLGFPYTRRYLAGRPESGVVLSSAQLACATVILALFLPLARSPTLHIGLAGAGSLLALGALGSGIAFAVNYSLVRSRGIAVASTVTYVMPVFSTALGAIVLGETVHWNQPLGTAVLLAGVALSQGRLPALVIRSRGRPESAPEAPS